MPNVHIYSRRREYHSITQASRLGLFLLRGHFHPLRPGILFMLLAYCCRIAGTGISKVDHAFLLSLQLAPPLSPFLLIHGKPSLPCNADIKVVMADVKDMRMKHIPTTLEKHGLVAI